MLRHPSASRPKEAADAVALVAPSEASVPVTRQDRCAECHTRGIPPKPTFTASHEAVGTASELWDEHDDVDLYDYDPFFVRQPFYYDTYRGYYGSGLGRFYATPWWLMSPTSGRTRSREGDAGVQNPPSQGVAAPAPVEEESSEPDPTPRRRTSTRERFGLGTTQKAWPLPNKAVKSGDASTAQRSQPPSETVQQRGAVEPSTSVSVKPKPPTKQRRPTARKRLR